MPFQDHRALIANDLKEIDYCNLKGQVEFDMEPIATRPNKSVYKGVYQGVRSSDR